MASNVDIQLLAGLDIDKSLPEIKEDIKSLESRLNAAGIKINLSANVDEKLMQVIKNLGKDKSVAASGKQLGENLAVSLINGYNIKSKDAQKEIKNLTRSIFQTSFDELKTGKDNPEFLNTFNKLGEVIKSNANIIQEHMGIYDNFYKYFQGIGKIKIPEIVQKDLGKDWDSMRRVAARKFVTDPNKKGTELDSIYQELADQYKDLFSGTADPTEQFREIVNAVKAYRADMNHMEPVDPSKVTGFEDGMWSDLLASIGTMRNQIKEQMPQIEEEMKVSAQRIKKSLMDVNASFDSSNSMDQLTEKVKGYFTSMDGISDENVKLQFFKDANEDVTSFSATIDKGSGIIEKYNFALNSMGQYVYSSGSVIDTTGKEFAELEQSIKELPADLEYLESKFKGANFKIPDNITQSFANIRQELSQIASIQDPQQKAQAYNRLTAELNNLTKQYRQLAIEQKNTEKDTKLASAKTLFGTNIDTWMNKNTSAAKIFASQLADIKSKLGDADKVGFDHLKSEFQNIQAEAKQMGLTTNDVVREIKSGFDSAVTRVVSFTAAFQTFKKMVNTAKTLDTSLFNLQVATGQTREETKGLLDTYNQMARELGSTTNSIADAADAWIRQGRTLDETNELVKNSLILSKIGMIDSADATEYLTSALNGYKLSADSALNVVSKLSSVDMAAAASSGGIAESMSKTASSAQQAGVSIDQLIGMIATLTDVSQASPENVGTAMKSIISRYTQVKANKFVDYESGDDLSNVEKVLAKVGVRIRDGVTDFRDLGDVLAELAEKWNTLNDVEQNAISYNLFGSYQSNFGRILLSNWDKVNKLTQISENSSTEALNKFAAYTDSVDAHINSMIASYEKLASTIADSEFLKGAADTGAAFLDTITAIIEKLGVMSTAMGAITAGSALRGHNIGVFDNNGTDITFLGKTIEQMKQASAEGQKFGGLFSSNIVQPISNAQSVIDNYNKLVANQCVNQNRINKLTDDLDMRKYLSGLNGAEAGMEGYTASLNMGTAATVGLKIATVALNMAFNMAVMGAVTAGVTFLVNKYKELNPTIEEATRSLEENQSELQKHADKVEELGKKLKEAQDKLEELNAVGGVKNLVDQNEMIRLQNVTNELKTQLAIEKERVALKARDTLVSAEKAYNAYEPKYADNGEEWKPQAVGAHGAYVPGTSGNLSNSPVEELDNTIKAYERAYYELQQMQTEIDQASATGDSKALGQLTTDYQNKQQELVDIRQHAYDTYMVVNGVNSAFKDISKSGETLTTAEQNMFDETSRGINIYNDFLGTIQNTAVDVDKLDDTTKDYAADAEQAAQAQEDLNAALKKTPEGKQIAAINEMSTGFEKIDKIMKDVKDKGTFDYSNLADTNFTKAFSGLDSYDSFIKTVSTYPSDLGKCQDAFNSLVTDFINASGIIDNLTDDTADLTTAMLSNMGVSNAEEVVTEALAAKHAQLAAQKYIDANASNDLQDATLAEYVQFLNEASGADVSQTALAQLELQKIAVNKVKIDTASDIDQIIAMANAAGASAESLLKLQRAKSILGQVEAGTLDMDVPGNNLLEAYANNTVNKLNDGTFDFDFQELDPEKFKKAVYDGGVKTNTPDKSGSKSGDKSSKEPTQFDWIERKLTLIDKQVERVKTKINDLVGYKNKNAATDTVIDLLNDKMTILQKSTERYQEELSKIDIPQEYIDKIKNGDFSVDNIAPSDKTLADKIKNYQDLYDKMVDCTDQITETKSSIKELNLSKLDNIINQFDQMTDIQSKILDTQQQILDLNEKAGETIYASDYIPLAQRQLEISKENAQAYEALAAEMAGMDLEQNTDEWKKYNDQLQEYKNNMLSAASAVEDYKDTMTELVYKELDDFKSKMDSINGTISTMNDLIGTTDLVDDNGKLTDRGIAQVALYAQQMANAKQEAAEYANAIDSLDDALSSGLITQDEYNSMLYEYTSAQESAVKANKEARDSILSLVKDGIQAEIDAKKELIDQTKAALEAEQDLHEYQQSISEKSSNIAKLERQIAALENSTDRADIAKKLQLQQDLADAQKDLYDTQYDHEMEQRKNALDDEYDAFEESKNKESDELDTNLDKQEAAIKEYLDQVKSNYSTAYGVLKQYGDDYSLSAIDALTEPWDSSSIAAETCADAIGDVTSNIQYEIDSLDFSSLYELVDLLNQIGMNSDYGASNDYETGDTNWKWQKGQGGRWWYGEDYDPNGGYDYASGGIYTINGKQYAFDDDGYMITGWNDDSGDWRYFEPENGEMVKDTWRQSNGKWYYLDSNGIMARDTTVKAKDGNGYWYVDEDGAWDGDEAANDKHKKVPGPPVSGYAKGTTHATGGWHMIDEAGPGSEVIMTKYGELVKLNDGDGVFTKEQTERLFNMIKNPDGYNPANAVSKVDLKPDVNVSPTTQNINVEMNVGGVLDEATLRIMEAQFPNMIRKNSRLLTNTVGDGVNKSLMGKKLSSRVYNR